jgi:hypothetical protein
MNNPISLLDGTGYQASDGMMKTATFIGFWISGGVDEALQYEDNYIEAQSQAAEMQFEDYHVLYTGMDFEGNPKSRWLAGTFVLLEVTPFDEIKDGVKFIKKLKEVASAIDKGGELTKVGRALQKHGDRVGSAFPKAKGNPQKINKQAEDVLDEMLSGDIEIIYRQNPRYGKFMDIKTPQGRGVRYSADGNTFIGLLEP